MLKKPIVFLSSHACNRYSSTCNNYRSHGFDTCGQGESKWHTYATVAHDSEAGETDQYIWPRSNISTSIPTPYEILQIRKNAPYTKHCYYRLVKIYHPDRDSLFANTGQIASLPRTLRIERYRLIVQAHEILSDPVKRKAYDKTGAGWAGRSELRPNEQNIRYWRENRWSGFNANNSPFANATWEDWERWYERHYGKRQKPQAPIYTSNSSFVTIVLAAVCIGAIGQRLNIESHDTFFREQADLRHDQASQYYRSRLTHTNTHPNMDSRIQKFLETREPNPYSPPTSDSQILKALPAPGQQQERSTRDHG